MTSRLRSDLEQSVQEARRLGPTELLLRLRTIPSLGVPVEFSGPVTTGALLDTRDTLLALVDENTHAIMDASALQYEARKPLFEDRIALTRVLVLINRKIHGREHADRTTKTSAHGFTRPASVPRQVRERP